MGGSKLSNRERTTAKEAIRPVKATNFAEDFIASLLACHTVYWCLAVRAGFPGDADGYPGRQTNGALTRTSENAGVYAHLIGTTRLNNGNLPRFQQDGNGNLSLQHQRFRL